MVETYDVVWGMTRNGKFTEILHETVEAETADEGMGTRRPPDPGIYGAERGRDMGP